MTELSKNAQVPQCDKTAVISGFYKEIGLHEYLKYGGNIEKINIEKTFTRYGDKNEKKPIERLGFSHFNEKGNCNIYNVVFKDGTNHNYSETWISTLVSFRLSENHL
jgi:hypothetical protein